MHQSRSIRVLVADDHETIRLALGQLLASVDDIEVVGLAVDGADAVSLAAALAPDVVVMDVSMPVLDGIEASRQIVAHDPQMRVVTLTAFPSNRDEAQRAGAAAHVLKDAPPIELIDCIRAVARQDEPSAPTGGW